MPVTGGEPAPADEILLLQLVENLRLCPLADQIAIGHQHDRCLGVRLHDADRLAGLHQQGLALVHGFERRHDPVVRGPIARGTAERGIDDKVVRILAYREHILEQAKKTFLAPALAA